MPIDQKTSDQFRVMLGYAIKNEVETFMSGIAEIGYTPYENLLALTIKATAHVVIDVANRYPNDADFEKIAGHAAKARTNLPIDQDEINAYLSKVVFGKDRVTSISDDQTKASVIPLFSLANLLIVFAPTGLDQWQWLDVIEASIDAAENTNEGVLPSMVYAFMHK